MSSLRVFAFARVLVFLALFGASSAWTRATGCEAPDLNADYVGTVPPNTCEGGMGVASQEFDIPIPMEPRRQK